MVGQALAWYFTVAIAGVLAFGALRQAGVGTGSSWAVARIVGLVAQGYLAFLAGSLGLTHWWWVGLGGLVALATWGWRGWKGVSARPILEVEALGCGAFVLLSLLRLPGLAITATEKPMDLAILATLLRPGTLPPADPWLAGFTLPYYYWGFVPWVLPAKVLQLAPDVAFNLIVPTLALVTAQAGWAVARALGGSRRTGAMASFLVVFAGTLDGWRQLLAGKSLAGLDLWSSSRQIVGTITEFPLFTFHLGDLHPHLLCVPMLLGAIFLARTLARPGPTSWVPFGAVVLLFGAAAAANPWCALPVGTAILLITVADEGGLIAPVRAGAWIWARVVAVGVLGWLLYLPFWLGFRPPTYGLGLVHTGTQLDQLILFLAAGLLAATLVAWELAWRTGGIELARRQLNRAGWLASLVGTAVLTRRPVFALAMVGGLLFALTVVRGRIRKVRPALALTLVPLGLLAGMELVFVKDPYGSEFYRMNTVFKATSVAFALLAVTTPVLLGWLRRRRPAMAACGAAAVLVIGLPQLTTLAIRAVSARPAGWGGLSWMEPGEARCVAWLRGLPHGSTMVEGVGDAYGEAARMSAASGVPTVLGWENHEALWRGSRINDELTRRKGLVTALYSAADPASVRHITAELGARYVVVGGLEHRTYPAEGLESVAKAGRVAFAAEACTIVEIP